MSRPFRPRPLDIHKKLPIVKSVKDLDIDEVSRSSLQSNGIGYAADSDHARTVQVQPQPTKRRVGEIPTPQCVVVDSYERDYQRTFAQPSSYVRGRGSRCDNTEVVEYDLDDQDDDWLLQYNKEEGEDLSPESFEWMLYKLELLDFKARERAGAIPAVFGVPVSVLLQQDAAFEVLRCQNPKNSILSAVFDYWKSKRERWQKPILRRLQPPPPVNDTNPFNVFRPREKTHRPHTRRTQRRENDVTSFEKLRQVRFNLEEAKKLLEILQKREEKKRELLDCEASIQRMRIIMKHDTDLGDELVMAESPAVTTPFPLTVDQGENTCTWKRRRAHLQARSRPSKRVTSVDSLDPIMFFVKPLDSGKLSSAGFIPPSDPLCTNGTSDSTQLQPYRLHARVGRGGRIIFDRWNPLTRTPIGAPDTASDSSRPPPQSLDTEKESDFQKSGGDLKNQSTTMR